ncbi:Ig-like domain-containing protein [Pseudomonadales bacterium]|nr:Ig-like domain-containing protein [Pseudomonadales bacterium]
MIYGYIFTAWLSLLVLFCPLATAQDGSGVPSMAFQQSELFSPLYTFSTNEIGARPTFAGMHRGYLIIAGGGVGNEPRALTFWDINNPTSPTLFSSTPDAGMFKTHAMGFSNNLMTARSEGGVLYDITDPANPQRRGTMGGAASSLWTYYAAPYIYKGGEGYGDASGWVSILDASDPDNIVVASEINMPALVGFRCGSTHVLGNLLVVSASQTNGVVTFDISDPFNPVLLDVLRVPGDIAYTSLLNGNRLYSGGQEGGLHVYDLTDPANIVHIGSVQPGGSPRYPMLQDEFIHLGNLGNDSYQKLDIDRLQVVTSAPLPGGFNSDPEFALPMGNLVFVGNSVLDTALPGGYLLAHDTEPDTRGMVVSAVRPADGETNVAISSMIGIALTDQIDPRSVDSTSFIIRPLGAAPLTGTYTTQTGTINFVPDQPLALGTTYEIVVVENGVLDLAGNGVVVESLTRFSTGSSVAGIVLQEPSDLLAEAELGTRVNLSWTNNSTAASALLIERKTELGPFLPLAQVEASAETYSDATTIAFTNYTYRVRAQGSGNSNVNVKSNSIFSNQTSVATPSFLSNSGLNAHWRFDANTVDMSGNEKVAVLQGDASYSIDGAVGSHSVQLEGSNNWISTDTLNLGSSFSLSLWAKVNSAHSDIQTLVANTSGGAPAEGFRFFINEYQTTNGSIRFETQKGLAGDVAFSPIGTFAFDQWNHLAVVVDRDNGIARLYYNGEDVTADSIILNDFNTVGSLELGRMLNNFELNGGIDDVRIYNSLLTPFDVSILADPSLPLKPEALNATAPSASVINLTWQDKSSNEAEFTIERKVVGTAAGNAYMKIASVGANAASYEDNGLNAATTYSYRIRSVNHNGVSAYSNEASSTTSLGSGAPGLMAHWMLDNNTIDSTINTNDGTLVGGATFSNDRVIGSHSLALDGFNDKLNVGHMELSERFTIAAWVKIDADNFNIQTVAANAPGGFFPDGFRFFINAYDTDDGSIVFETGNDDQGDVALSPPGTFAFDQWNHVAVVVDRPAGIARIFYNGNDVTTDVTMVGDFNISAPIHLGEMSGSGHWLDGHLDDVRIYARALNAAEVAGLAAPGSGGPLSVQLSPTLPVLAAAPLSMDVSHISGGEGVLEYSWNFNDGSSATPFLTSSAVEHVFTEPGHYSVQLVVRDQQGQQVSKNYLQTVHLPVTTARPMNSSTIVYDSMLDRVWNVNPDNDSVTVIDASTFAKIGEYSVGDNPRTLTVGMDGSIWVANQDDASISVLNAIDGSLIQTITLAHGSAPYGIVRAPQSAFNSALIYVTLEATGELIEISSQTGQVLRTVNVGSSPRGIAVTADGQRILVTRFISPSSIGEVTDVNATGFSVSSVIPLAKDPGPDTPSSGRGVPNYISSISISPDGMRAWVPSKKDNTERGTFLEQEPLTFESTVRTIASKIDLSASVEQLDERIDFDNSSMASAVAFSPRGDWAFVALTGNNQIDVRDAYSGSSVSGFNTGLAPQGLVLSPDGSRLFVHNFMQRSVSTFDVSELSLGTGVSVLPLSTIPTVASEILAPSVLKGKQIFYNAADARMSLNGYISCASCHLEGGQDGRVWDFTDRGLGLRNTIDLRGRAGLGHGNLHWTANFDEIQDFENEARSVFGGTGFLSDAQFAQTADPLGLPKAGLSADLDALAAYTSSLTTLPNSPYREADGSLTATAEAGRTIFNDRGCSSCHEGARFIDNVRHDIGTVELSSGTANGQLLQGAGFDTPTLKGIWSSAPYLHNGQAATLEDVLLIPSHGAASSLNHAERTLLIDYLLQIDNSGESSSSICVVGQSIDDNDCDGLLNNIETNTGIFLNSSDTGTDPNNSDTDADGLLDGVETNTGIYIDASDTGTDPNNSDTDGDSLLDGVETNTEIYVDASNTGTSPHDSDTDNDGLDDGVEVANGTDPTKVEAMLVPVPILSVSILAMILLGINASVRRRRWQ